MAAKLVVVLVLVAVAHSLSQPGFTYEAGNPNTGDYQSHSEGRVGDVVHGHYSVQEPDGSRRIVTYIADEDGFNAAVHKCPPGWERSLAAAARTAVHASAPAAVLARAPYVSSGLVDARVYPAPYRTVPSDIYSWPYGFYVNL